MYVLRDLDCFKLSRFEGSNVRCSIFDSGLGFIHTMHLKSSGSIISNRTRTACVTGVQQMLNLMPV